MADKKDLTQDEQSILEAFELACSSTLDMLQDIKDVSRAEAKKLLLDYLEAAAITEKLPGVN